MLQMKFDRIRVPYKYLFSANLPHTRPNTPYHGNAGVVLGVRNPGSHSFPEGTEQRAIEYISLLSLLAYRVQEAKRKED
jgi:hypothetical protein